MQRSPNSPVEFVIAKQGLRNLGTLAEFLPEFTGGVTAARESWMKKNEATTIGFLRAYLRGIAYFHDRANKETVITRGGMLLGFDPDVMRNAYEHWFEKPLNGTTIAEMVVPKSGRLSLKGLQTSADAFFDIGSLKSRYDFTEFMNHRYLDLAKQPRK
jgi:ABC-type nitrate/sulfonate/bicarbonate transport system substrate-binding protein